MSIRVRLSRALSRRLLRSERMTCSELALRKHPAERWVDALFWLLRGETRHSERCADWEAHREREADAVDDFRRAGWL